MLEHRFHGCVEGEDSFAGQGSYPIIEQISDGEPHQAFGVAQAFAESEAGCGGLEYGDPYILVKTFNEEHYSRTPSGAHSPPNVSFQRVQRATGDTIFSPDTAGLTGKAISKLGIPTETGDVDGAASTTSANNWGDTTQSGTKLHGGGSSDAPDTEETFDRIAAEEREDRQLAEPPTDGSDPNESSPRDQWVQRLADAAQGGTVDVELVVNALEAGLSPTQARQALRNGMDAEAAVSLVDQARQVLQGGVEQSDRQVEDQVPTGGSSSSGETDAPSTTGVTSQLEQLLGIDLDATQSGPAGWVNGLLSDLGGLDYRASNATVLGVLAAGALWWSLR